MKRTQALAIGLCLSVVGEALAGGSLHDVDIILAESGDQVTTSRVISGNMTEPEHVFVAQVFDLAGVFILVDDPGFNSLTGALPALSVCEWEILDALRVWDGSSFDDISGFTIEFTFGAQSVFSTTTPQVSPGSIAMAVSDIGDIHHHPRQFLEDTIEDGIYLMRFRMSNSAVMNPSDDFYMVYPWNADQADVDAAVAYVQHSLVACPGDLDGDGAVGASDLANVIGVWNSSDLSADLDQNGVVGAGDLADLIGRWGACP